MARLDQFIFQKNLFNFGQELSNRPAGQTLGRRLMFVRLLKGVSMPHAVFSITSVNPPHRADQSQAKSSTSFAKEDLYEESRGQPQVHSHRLIGLFDDSQTLHEPHLGQNVLRFNPQAFNVHEVVRLCPCWPIDPAR